MTAGRLFDPPGETVPAEAMSADRRRTAANNALLARGVHPAPRLPLLDARWGLTCGACAHHVTRAHDRVWHKCRRHRLGMSSSAASDIRVSWPACTAYRLDPETSR